jgi:hypothetical protein
VETSNREIMESNRGEVENYEKQKLVNHVLEHDKYHDGR